MKGLTHRQNKKTHTFSFKDLISQDAVECEKKNGLENLSKNRAVLYFSASIVQCFGS